MKNLSTTVVGVLLIISCVASTTAFPAPEAAKATAPAAATNGTYVIQWISEYGDSDWTDARYQGPQPIGDADNDGDNELLISGRDCALRVMEWQEDEQTYQQTHVLRPPFYPFVRCDAGGMAIGDVTNDGKNEIAATWYDTIYRYALGRYWRIGANPWIFLNNGGSADCLIGDCDNDGRNELIVSGGSWRESPVGEITVLRWNGLFLQRVAEYDDPATTGYVYMAGLGDIDFDGDNEIACAYSGKLVVLDWDATTEEFVPTLIKYYPQTQGSPFGCVCKDCDGDGKAELLLSFYDPQVEIYKWNGTAYVSQFFMEWPGADPVIEGIDVGDTDDDGMPEVCVGAGQTYVLQWDGSTYAVEATLPTFGWMAVVCIGDCDNDGKNEINCGNVEVEEGLNFTEWVFKYQAP